MEANKHLIFFSYFDQVLDRWEAGFIIQQGYINWKVESKIKPLVIAKHLTLENV